MRRTIFLIAVVLALPGCRRTASMKDGGSGIGALASDDSTRPLLQVGKGTPGSGPADPSRPQSIEAGRKLIRNGEISIEVRDFEAGSRKAGEIARSFGGYVAESAASGDTGRRSGTLTVRVRADAFDEALGALRALGKVQNEHVRTNDVTKAYTDLETRLRVKRDAAERIREILKTRSTRLADVLAAEKELSGLVEQIETMEGEKRYYDQLVALSTITAELHEPETVTRPSAFAPLRAALRDSLYNLSESLAAFVTGMLYVLPWAVLLLPITALWSRRRRRRGSEAPAS